MKGRNSSSTEGQPELAVADYGAASRPAKVVDVMHQAVTRYQDRVIAFYPIIDAIILLLGKSVALIFHRIITSSSSPEPFSATYPDADLSALTRQYQNDPVLASTLVPLPAPEGSDARFLVSLANIVEEEATTPGQRPHIRLEPYRVTTSTVREHLSPDGLHGAELDLWLLKRLFHELKMTCGQGSILSPDVMLALNEGLKLREPCPDPKPANGSPWRDHQAAEWEKARDDMMEKYWRDIVDQSLQRATRLDGAGSNALVRQRLGFLCVFRFALPGTRLRAGKFAYGARIVLSRQQRAAVRQWLGSKPEFRSTNQGSSETKAALFQTEFKSDPDAVIRALELPLGMNYQSISDTHFRSGFIDFAPEATYAKEGPRSGPAPETAVAPERVGGAERHDDRIRKVAERLVLDEVGSRVFYVPIHVGGVPWLGLLILEDEDRGADVSNASWEESYHLYRGPVATIGQQMRLSCHNAYSAALCAAVNQELTSSTRDVFPEINRRWQKLSAFFPFEAVTLVPGTGRGSIEFPGGKRAVLEKSPNPHSCFNRALNFDRLHVPALQHDLKTVLETVVAKRLGALALQESAWAHDVKNWTNPILAELFSLSQQQHANGSESDSLYRALIHTRILNATAYARQISGPRQRDGKPSQDALDAYLEFASGPDLEKLLALVIDLLLATHAENPSHRETFELEWPQKRPVKEVLTELSEFIGGDQFQRLGAHPSDVIGQPVVIWPLSLLREVVHNIDINTPVGAGVPDEARISMNYRLERTPTEVIVHISQSNVEGSEWEDDFPQGLQKANSLYGPHGANVGWIDENPKLEQTEIFVTGSNGKRVPAVKVAYSLRIRFFLGGSGHGASRGETS